MSQSPTLPCWIYRSGNKDEMYLYLAREGDFDRVPEGLMRLFGEPVPVMQLELHAGRPLAREDVHQVMSGLKEQGYFLQMPPPPPHRLLDA